MEMLIKENEKFSKMLKKAIATGAVAVIVGGGAMVPVYASNGTDTREDLMASSLGDYEIEDVVVGHKFGETPKVVR